MTSRIGMFIGVDISSADRWKNEGFDIRLIATAGFDPATSGL